MNIDYLIMLSPLPSLGSNVNIKDNETHNQWYFCKIRSYITNISVGGGFSCPLILLFPRNSLGAPGSPDSPDYPCYTVITDFPSSSDYPSYPDSPISSGSPRSSDPPHGSPGIPSFHRSPNPFGYPGSTG